MGFWWWCLLCCFTTNASLSHKQIQGKRKISSSSERKMSEILSICSKNIMQNNLGSRFLEVGFEMRSGLDLFSIPYCLYGLYCLNKGLLAPGHSLLLISNLAQRYCLCAISVMVPRAWLTLKRESSYLHH